MLNSTITIKIKQRLNKLDSQDYDNLECWQIVEAFNKAQVEWARRQLHGVNMTKEGDEQSNRRKDDLQVLLSKHPLQVTNKEYYYFGNLPEDYMQWKRVDVYAKQDCCDKRRMTVYLAEEGNLNQLLRDKSKQLAIIDIALANKERETPEYIQMDEKNKKVKFVRIPKFEEVPYPIVMEPNLVIEYYSR